MLRWLTAGESHGPELVAILDLPTLRRTHDELEAYRAGLRRR